MTSALHDLLDTTWAFNRTDVWAEDREMFSFFNFLYIFFLPKCTQSSFFQLNDVWRCLWESAFVQRRYYPLCCVNLSEIDFDEKMQDTNFLESKEKRIYIYIYLLRVFRLVITPSLTLVRPPVRSFCPYTQQCWLRRKRGGFARWRCPTSKCERIFTKSSKTGENAPSSTCLITVSLVPVCWRVCCYRYDPLAHWRSSAR